MPRCLLSAVMLAFAATAGAADMPTYRLDLHDGVLEPDRIVVRAGERFKLELHNRGDGPAEFESTRLRKEKVLAPGVSSFVVVHPLSPGEYGFYDEFHLPKARGTIVAE